MKILNWIRKIIAFPFRLIIFLPFFLMGFLMTDWEDEESRSYYKKELKGWFK